MFGSSAQGVGPREGIPLVAEGAVFGSSAPG